MAKKPRSYTVTDAGIEQRAAAGSVSSPEKTKAARENASVTSERKARASRKNGRRGGRPGNPEIKRIMAKLGVSRQRAWQILNER